MCRNKKDAEKHFVLGCAGKYEIMKIFNEKTVLIFHNI